MTPDRCEKVNAGCIFFFGKICSLAEALVNVSGNYNRSKVKIIALVKSDYMLERLW